MIGFNGGLIGKYRSPAGARRIAGVWGSTEQVLAKNRNLWASLSAATGGDTIAEATVDGILYNVHTFTTTGTSSLVLPFGANIDCLIVGGGGGGGGGFQGGGGGAGGYLLTSLEIPSGTYTVVVGAGGSGHTTPATPSTIPKSGGDSIFYNLIARGGGRGAGESNVTNVFYDALVGGSGGGGAHGGGLTGAAGTSGQGNAGGNGFTSTSQSGGGGGGSGGAGTNADGTTAQPAGGAGTTSSFDGTSRTYAVGGAGSRRASNITGSAGTANRGNGGGGGSSTSGTGTGGAGGSGIVIIRYPI